MYQKLRRLLRILYNSSLTLKRSYMSMAVAALTPLWCQYTPNLSFINMYKRLRGIDRKPVKN